MKTGVIKAWLWLPHSFPASPETAQKSNDELAAGKRWLALRNDKGDSDNTVSKEEFDRYMNQQFDKADTDHDGTLDAKELGHLRVLLMSQ